MVRLWTKGCTCKTGCKNRSCGCRREGKVCGPGCGCKSLCYNSIDESVTTVDEFLEAVSRYEGSLAVHDISSGVYLDESTIELGYLTQTQVPWITEKCSTFPRITDIVMTDGSECPQQDCAPCRRP